MNWNDLVTLAALNNKWGIHIRPKYLNVRHSLNCPIPLKWLGKILKLSTDSESRQNVDSGDLVTLAVLYTKRGIVVLFVVNVIATLPTLFYVSSDFKFAKERKDKTNTICPLHF